MCNWHHVTCHPAIKGMELTAEKRASKFAVEDDAMDTLARDVATGGDGGGLGTARPPKCNAHARFKGSSPIVKDGQCDIIFFRPVDTIGHLTLLGDAPRKCDFVAEVLSIESIEPTTGPISQVIVGPAFGENKLAKLSHLDYVSLSATLRVWEFGESGYHVTCDMHLGCSCRVSECVFFEKMSC